jgi:ElaB/YqjD/DUF883 family membrane-anchored ribosome-binding protein
MRHQTTVSHARHNGHARVNGLSKRLGHLRSSIANRAEQMRGKTSRLLSKSLRNAKSKTKSFSKDVDRVVIKNRYQTIGAAVVAGLCLGYFLKK